MTDVPPETVPRGAPRRNLPYRMLAAVLLVFALALAAVAYRMQLQLRGGDAVLIPFNADEAMSLAGGRVPPDVESFYFFILDSGSSVSEEADELAGKLEAAAQEHEYLGIAGPDPERNLATLVRALEASDGKDLTGLVVIYLGPEDHRARLDAPIAATGASLDFVEFPPASSI